MGRKKKSAKRADARGYQQGATSSSSNIPRAASASTSKTASKKKTTKPLSLSQTTRTAASSPIKPIEITSSIHRDLEELLEALRKDHDENTTPTAATTVLSDADITASTTGPSDRFTKRMGTIYDNLTEWGFAFEQIQRAVQALGYSITLETALDWLCVHLSTTELPALFTEGQVRDDTAAVSSGDIVGLTVVAPPPATSATAQSSNRLVEPSYCLARNVKQSTKKLQKHDVYRPAKPSQKDWILQQYAYEQEEDEEDEVEVKVEISQIDSTDEKEGKVESISQNALGETETSPVQQQQQFKRQTYPEPQLSYASLKMDELTALEERLQKTQQELQQMEADLKDDAANYMRSKYEIKEMQKQAKQLRNLVQSLEGKINKQKAEQERAKVNDAVDEQADSELEEDVGAGFFGTVSDEDASDKEETIGAITEFSEPYFFRKGTIPKSWTGKTPKEILEDWCRKEKIPRPSFQKLDDNGCLLSVKISRDDTLQFRQDKLAEDYKDSQHYAATRALYEINPCLPLYRTMPPFYRDMWLQWTREALIEKEGAERALDKARQDLIDELIRSIPQALSVLPDKNVPATKDEDTLTLRQEKDGNQRVPSCAALEDIAREENQRLANEFVARQKSAPYQRMLEARKQLPVYSYQQSILESVAKNSVTIISAETGAGKTTQVPQFILSKALEEGNGSTVSVVCTQPRRVAATSVAERVSEEMGEKNIGGLIGYQIRLESKRSKATKLIFCTTGVILRRLVDDPNLEGTTHIVVDEAHERQWQIDLLLAALRQLLQGPRPDLKVVLMSATLDTALFTDYFGNSPLVTVPGRAFPVAHYYLDDLIEKTGHIIEEGSRCAVRNYDKQETVSLWVTTRGGERRRETAALESEIDVDVSDDFFGYSLPTRRSMDRVDESVINYDLIEEVLALIYKDKGAFLSPDGQKVADGSILVFLPGIGEIRALSEILLASRLFGKRDEFEVIPLHSSLSTIDQRRAFQPPRKGVTKIIATTNIAETSVTIPDVTIVIDSGLMREIQRDKRTNTQKLVATWCSRANTKQRAGRAGRLQPGICLRLFSSKTEKTMKKAAEPELKRIPLEEICLTVLASGLTNSCKQFLSLTPEPPPETAIVLALETLRNIGALTFDDAHSFEKLTPLGEHLTKLPIDAKLGKLLIFGCIFRCLSPALTLAAVLSASKSPFATSVTEKATAKAKHASFTHPTSDFLALINVWEAYRSSLSSGVAKQFCRDNCLNYQSLEEIREARNQFLALLCDIGFVRRDLVGLRNGFGKHDAKMFESSFYCTNSHKEGVIHSVLCAGLYPNVANLKKENESTTTIWQRSEELMVRSTSVNSQLPSPLPSSWMAFHDKLSTGGKRTSISTTCFVHPFSIMIFGPSMKVLHTEKRVVVDGWIELGVSAKTGVMFREVRDHVDRVLKQHVKSVSSKNTGSNDLNASSVIDGIANLLGHTA